MARFVWKQDAVFSMALKDGSYVLGQLLKEPYMVFFHEFRDKDEWEPTAAQGAQPLLFCAVTRQFLIYSPIEKQPSVLPRAFERMPSRWIERIPGTRQLTIWKGTSDERTMVLLSERPGGQLIEKHIEASGFQEWPVVKKSIALDDDETIDGHEESCLWLYPQLNERLSLCKQVGRCVDPSRDLTFGRPPKKEYATFYDMLACHGKPEDWGYGSKPYDSTGKRTQQPRTKNKPARG